MNASNSVMVEGLESIGDLYYPSMVKYTKVCSVTVIFLEAMCTLPDEIKLVWPSPLGLMTVLYYVNKYLPFVDTTMAIIMDLGVQDAMGCRDVYETLAYIYVAGTLCSEFILMARTAALWANNKYVIALMTGAAVLFTPFVFYVVSQTVLSTQYYSKDVLRVIGCLPCIQDQDSWPAYFCMMLAETGIIVLTLLKRYLHSDGMSKGLLIQTMFRDGSLFFAIVLSVSVLNVLVMLFAPRGLTPLIQMPLRAVHSALCTRVLLNLRKAAAETDDLGGQELTNVTTAVFASRLAPRSHDVENITPYT